MQKGTVIPAILLGFAVTAAASTARAQAPAGAWPTGQENVPQRAINVLDCLAHPQPGSMADRIGRLPPQRVLGPRSRASYDVIRTAKSEAAARPPSQPIHWSFGINLGVFTISVGQ
jgi:hypothetical protein